MANDREFTVVITDEPQEPHYVLFHIKTQKSHIFHTMWWTTDKIVFRAVPLTIKQKSLINCAIIIRITFIATQFTHLPEYTQTTFTDYNRQ